MMDLAEIFQFFELCCHFRWLNVTLRSKFQKSKHLEIFYTVYIPIEVKMASTNFTELWTTALQ